MQDTYSQKLNDESVSQITKSSGYICPFSKEVCTHSESLSSTQTIICDYCENFRPEDRTDLSNRSDFGSSTKIIFLSDKLHSVIKWK